MNFHKIIFIGTIFQFINIHIGTFDIVPDLAGFIIMAIAFANLKWKYASLGFYVSIVLSIISFAQLFYVQTETIFTMKQFDWTTEIFGLTEGVLMIILYACVFAVSRQLLPEDTSGYPKVFLSVQFLLLLWPAYFLHRIGSEVEVISMLLVGLAVVTMIGYLIFLWRRKNLEQGLIDESRGPLVISQQ